MPNLMPDPGYELESHTVVNNTGAGGFVSSPVRSGVRALRLRAESAGTPDSAQSPAITVGDPGVERIFLFYVRPTIANASLKLRVKHYPDGLAEPAVVVSDFGSALLVPNAWNLRSVTITPAAADDRIEFEPYISGPFFGSIDWYFDDLVYPGEDLIAVAKGMYDGWSALLTGLKSINGSAGGYWNDFRTPGGGTARVHGPLLIPADHAEIPSPYLCIPFVDEPETYADQERGEFAEWDQTIYAFVRDTKDDPLSTATIESVAKIRDDLVKYLTLNPKLGGTVNEVHLIGSGRSAGYGGEHDWGEFQLVVRMRQFIDPSVLGPGA